MKLDALFFAAHPDDAELCAGGTIYKLSKAGKKTGIIDLTRGELSTRGSVSVRQKESINAGKILGISVRENLKIPDGNIENTSKNRLKVISVIRKYKPSIIFLPHFHDRHPDHFHTHELVKEGAFYSGLSKIKTPNLAPHRPGRSFYYMQTYEFLPNVIIDISEAFYTKMRAISCYQTQFYNPGIKAPETFISDKKFIEFIESRSRFYGFKIGAKYGEPFYTEEHLKIGVENLFHI